MVYRKKGRFVLDIDHLQGIVDDILKERSNSDVIIKCEKSPHKRSKSLYLKIYIGEYSTCLRLSDHKCKGVVREIIIGESTGDANIYYKVERAIKDLRHRKFCSLLWGGEYGSKV